MRGRSVRVLRLAFRTNSRELEAAGGKRKIPLMAVMQLGEGTRRHRELTASTLTTRSPAQRSNRDRTFWTMGTASSKRLSFSFSTSILRRASLRTSLARVDCSCSPQSIIHSSFSGYGTAQDPRIRRAVEEIVSSI
jgi:hypothetical protein